MKHISIIGAGNLGISFYKGLLKTGAYKADQFTLCRRSVDRLKDVAEPGTNITNNIEEACEKGDIVIVAVLPQQSANVLKSIKCAEMANKIFVSLISGVETSELKKFLGQDAKIVRAMPNTAIAVGESMTCIAANPEIQEEVTEISNIFDLLGKTLIIRENQMTSATALCACGIAFFLRAIRAASQGGNEIDFHSDEALLMAAQTAKGAATLLIENNSHPEDEIDRVTSPKGCTIAGLNQMEHNGFSSAFIRGIVSSAEKAKDLYKED